MVPEVEYLSHKISKHGIEPTMEKVRAITEAPHPKNVAELRAFLGLINYYGKFLPDLVTVLNPLYCFITHEGKVELEGRAGKSFPGSKGIIKITQTINSL